MSVKYDQLQDHPYKGVSMKLPMVSTFDKEQLAVQQPDALLAQILTELKEKDDDDNKCRAAKSLQQYVSLRSRDFSSEIFKKWMKSLLKNYIWQLINSPIISEKVGGLIAVVELIEIAHDEFVAELANYYRFALKTDDSRVLGWSAKAIGHMSRINNTITAECVEFDLMRALEWLQGERQGVKRLAACLILKELAVNSPTLFYGYISQFIDLIWIAIRDTSREIRECAIQALEASLQIIRERESRFRQNWYHKMFEESQKGFNKQSNVDIVHASLLTVGVMVVNTGDYLKDRFNGICQTVLKFKEHKDKLIKKTVIEILPKLAAFMPDKFVHNYLENALNYLLNVLRKDTDCRAYAFLAVGEISIIVKHHIRPYTETIFGMIRVGLTTKAKGSFTNSEALVCCSNLATACGSFIVENVRDVLDNMFAGGINLTLTNSLREISVAIPELSDEIHEKLLDLLSMTLYDRPFDFPGTPHRFRKQEPNVPLPLQASGTDSKKSELVKNDEAVSLALNILSNFNFDHVLLVELLRDGITRYLSDPAVSVRREAAICCCKLLIGICQKTNTFSQILNEVLEKVVSLGISDEDSVTRKSVLLSLDPILDSYLCQASVLKYLFVSLNDELFEIRETSLKTICRLSKSNPANVMPTLRRIFLRLLTQLDSSADNLTREESSRLLGLLTSSVPSLVKPYVLPLMQSLMPKLRDPDAGVSSSVLSTVGELAAITGSDMLQNMDELIPLIIESLQDQSSPTKREVAIRTLGKLAENTGYVVTPFIKYPKLLDTILTEIVTETNSSIRKEVIRVIGIIGALDPYKHKQNELILEGRKNDEEGTGKTPKADPTAAMTDNLAPSSEDYYPTISVAALIKILKDPSLQQHHTLVVHTLMFIVKGLGGKSVQFLGYILPQFLQIIKTCEPDFRSTIFQQLGVLVSRVKQHIRNYLPDILNLIHEYWRSTVNLVHVISLIEEISLALADEFRGYVPSLLPFLLQLLQLDFDSVKTEAVSKALHALGVFGQSLIDYVHLILPVVIRLSEQHHIPKKLKLDALQALNSLCKNFDVVNFSSLLIHSLTRVLDTPFPDVQQQCLTVVCTIIKQIGRDFLLFEPGIRRVINRHEVTHPQYEAIVLKLKGNEPLERSTSDEGLAESGTGSTDAESDAEEVVESSTGVKKIKLNEANLKRAWEISEGSTKEDWSEWLKQLSVALLRESPSPALRSCISLANDYYPLVKELFNAAFISCWSDMSESYQSELVRTLEAALTNPTIPPDILQTLLNLAEFMEQNETPLPIDPKTLSRLAEQCHAYAKALHYKEMEFRNSPTQFIEQLISINNKLQHPEAALGVLIYAQKNHGVQLKESWYEKLQRWDLALQAYEKNAKMYPGSNPPAANLPTASSSMKYTSQTSPPGKTGRVHSSSITQMDEPTSVIFGKMRCLQALGEWEQLGKLSQDMWMHSTPSHKMRIAGLGASSAWNLSQWELFSQYVDVIPHTTLDGSFFRAVLSVHEENFKQAQHFIDTARKIVDRELTALVGESYNRSYNLMVKVQQLVELEEIIVFKQFPEQRQRVVAIWDKRLAGNQRNVDTWQNILLVRSLVLSPVENMKSWLKFATLCRKSGRLDLSYKTVVKLLGVDPASQNSQGVLPLKHPRVTYSYLKQLWAIGENQRAYEQLKRFPLVKEDPPLQARIFMKLGQWQSMLEGFNNYTLPQIIQALNGAVDYDKSYKKAWSLWALANIEAVSFYEKATSMNTQQAQRLVVNHLVNAINGLFKSIALSRDGQFLQDTLRILTLWFNHGAIKEVENALNEGFLAISLDTWLQVIPQLIARIHSPVNTVRKMINDLLNNIGKIHPQALVYPLTVATKSQSTVRVQEARAVLDKITKHSPRLVEQAELVSNELVRVSILWIEMWHEALEEASRACFVDNDIPGMLNTLRPLHQMMEKAPETLKESQFQQAYAAELREANEWCKKWERTHKSNDLNQAWELYTQVFRRIDKLLPTLTSLELAPSSPKLVEVNNLELAVPGTYKAGSPVVCIKSFNPMLSIISSKQRPRKIIINGSDGHEYMFLLKGHEDLRQDERVMQLFGLVNNLLNNDYETSKNHLSIQRYSVVPLSPNSGLIGWVTHCDTLHYLIKEYRDAHKIWLNIEHRLMLQMAPDYSNLTLIQKVEAFDYAMENTTGNDLQRILWLRSSDSEVWLDRRLNYTRSLAVMSMVGYILGLGDRHPSNLMLDRHTGTVVHIDFGDCFEVAMHREKYPEKIPFRLTRMLIHAMEVSGIEGTFRFSCENTMRVLRNHKDSLMAVLEAFVYDPIINWRLLTNASPDSTKSELNTSSDKLNPSNAADALNKRAYQVINRVNKKLTGKDFQNEVPLDIPEQVQRLINQATSTENLCQCFMGWCPFW